MISGFSDTIQQAGAHDSLDPEQWKDQAVLVERRSRE